MSAAHPRYKRVNPAPTVLGANQHVFRYQIVGGFQGQETISSLDYVSTITGPTIVTMLNFLGAASTALFAKYKACVGTDWACTEERVLMMSDETLAPQASIGNAGVAGTGGSLSTDSEIAAIILKTSALKGQHGRGRLSLPAVPSGSIGGSVITGAALKTALGTLATEMLAVLNDGTNNYDPIIGSYYNSPKPGQLGAYSLMVQAVYNTLLGTIRRRKIGRGK
jgi:hypothetical protein